MFLITYYDVFILALILLAGCFFFILAIISQKVDTVRKERKTIEFQKQLVDKLIFHKDIKVRYTPKKFIKNFFKLSQEFKFEQTILDEAYTYLNRKKYIKKLFRNLSSDREYKRIEAITYLSLFNNEDIKTALCKQLNLERKEHIKILIVNGLKNNLDEHTLKAIITSLYNSRRYYQSRAIKIISKYVDQTEYDLSIQLKSPILAVRETFVDMCQEVYHPNFKQPLIDTMKEIEDYFINNHSDLLKRATKERINRLYYQTLTALSKFHNFSLKDSKYINHPDSTVSEIAVNSLTNTGDLETIKYLLTFASHSKRDSILTEGIIRICERNKNFYIDIYKIFNTSLIQSEKLILAGALSHKMDYFILNIENENEFNHLLSFMIRSNYSINIINWLNYNKNEDINNRILKVIKPISKDNYLFFQELNDYLRHDLFEQLGYTQTPKTKIERPETNPEVKRRKWLTTFLVILTLILPTIFILFNIQHIGNMTFVNILERYIIDINKLFIGYYLVINVSYIFFAIIALIEYNKQEKLWNIKNEDFLYEDGVISPISILVPAYNEGMNIIENVNSLLSLKYPIYEVIVVNDGSNDDTLKKLINEFDLKRVEYTLDSQIITMPIKAVYKNKFYEKLIVVDKENGGKADSLNVGINMARYDYVCGIDADSLIESNGLLKMMSTVLDTDSITLALGGSIVPVNGAIVDHGVIEEYHLPQKVLAKFQTIEYIRAFNAGRLGFSNLKCFLIVSGAFGLFEKRMLKDIGGYLTASTSQKDTVGEDMELVVRIAEKASEEHLNYTIRYVPMARCYTEVPEDRKSFFSQRNRWQKGLIDTLSYHRKMIFNKKYGNNGLISMPYYLIFEMLGPVLEAQVLLTIILGLIFGLFDGVLLALLFVVTILLGMLVTLVSIFLQEKYTEPLSIKDTLKQIFYTIIENFGWRQLISIYRTKGFFTSFKDKHNWGRIKRTGFKK